MELSALALVIPAFIAGIITFLAPCTLPLVPAYIAFISGVSLEEFKNPEYARAARRHIMANSILYVTGFSLVFILFGLSTGILAQIFSPAKLWLTRIAGVFIIIFGALMLASIRWPFSFIIPQLPIIQKLKSGARTPFSSLMLGAAFAFGWTPCVGPVLGSILLLASTQGTAFKGALLLAVFSLGLAIPFLLVAAGISSAVRYIRSFSRFLNAVSVIGGLALVGIGILLLSNNFAILISYGYRLFQFINYDAIINYL